jgi:hypothetical protein
MRAQLARRVGDAALGRRDTAAQVNHAARSTPDVGVIGRT